MVCVHVSKVTATAQMLRLDFLTTKFIVLLEGGFSLFNANKNMVNTHMTNAYYF